jgi:chromosome segregation ATPase
LEVSDWESLNNSIGDFNDAMQSANTEYEEATAKTEATALAAAEYVERLRDLEAAGLDTAQAQYDYKRIVGELNSLIPTLNLTIDEQTGLLVENKDAILNDIKAWSKMSATSSYQRKLQQQSEALGDAELAVYEAQYKLTGLQEDAAEIEAELAEKSAELAKAQEELSHCIQRCGDSAYAAAAGSLEETQRYEELEAQCAALADEVYDLQNAQQSNKTEQDALNDAIKSGTETVSQHEDEIKAVSEAMDKFGQSSKDVKDDQSDLQLTIEDVQAELDALNKSYMDTCEAAFKSIDTQIGLFTELEAKSEWTASKIIENWSAQQRAFENYSANLQKAIDMGFDAELVRQFTDASQQSMMAIDALVNSTEISVDEINKAFRDRLTARIDLGHTLTEIKGDFDATYNEIIADAKEAFIYVIDGAVVSIDNNAYKLENAMTRAANRSVKAFKVAMDINSPSRVMEHETEFVIDGAVLGIDRNVADFEAAMERMAYAGRDSYVQAQLSRAEDYPVMYSPAVQPIGGGANYTRHYGGFNIQIHQQPGQSPDDLVDVLMDRIQTLVDSKEAGL